MAPSRALASYFKQGGYDLILTLAGREPVGCVNTDELRYIFRNFRPAPGGSLLVGREVAYSEERRRLPLADTVYADCGVAVVL